VIGEVDGFCFKYTCNLGEKQFSIRKPARDLLWYHRWLLPGILHGAIQKTTYTLFAKKRQEVKIRLFGFHALHDLEMSIAKQ